MSTAVAAKHPYVEALLKGCTELPHSPLSWLDGRRAAALERANALTIPTTREEEWRFTDITPLTRIPFRPGRSAPRLTERDIARFETPEAAIRLTFVDGVFSPELSATAGLPYGVLVKNLAAGLETHCVPVEPHLARHAAFERDVFAALNTCYLRDGALVIIARNQDCPTPVHLLFVAAQKEIASYPRCLVIAEAGSRCTLIEDYVALGEDAYFSDPVTEIVLGDGARVTHVKLQREARSAFHIATCAVALGKDAEYASHTVTLGARISRYNLSVVQQGEGARARIDGLALVSGRQLADTHSFMDHARPAGKCVQLHKCIIGDAAHAVFNGRIVVRPGAQLTDAAQESRNLLLSGTAHVDTKPQLEIFADDVRCSHGATVGQLEQEQMFYLRSRGLSEARAHNLLIYAFGAEIIDRIPVPSLVAQLGRTVLEQAQTAA
ncbi:MAG: Fe-S cluster assembly protein SufD [Betaproteobacteria bacterium]|nr:Fe-S cluster assembly protein SufD [Betaproteobacteria bacterium]